MHESFELTQIAIVALAALAGGVLLERFKQPAVLGYIFAGVMLGPSVFGLIENRELVSMLAELGVLLLLFLIGLELNLQDFKKTWHISLISTVLQLSCCLIVIFILGTIFKLSTGLIVILACSIALSSTAVVIKMLEGIGELKTPTGKLTIGILIGQDLAVVPIILIIRSLSETVSSAQIALKILFSIAFLALIIWFLSKREKIKIPFEHIVKSSPDLIPLLSLGLCFGLAALSGLVGLSAAYGAFIAGIILGNTSANHSLVKSTKPIQSILMMVFFLSIGLLMDLGFIWDHLGKVLLLMLFITVGKTALNIGVLHFLKQTWPVAFLSGLLLSQMGEFAFLLTTVGQQAKLLDSDGAKFIISITALSLSFSPLWLSGARRIHDLAPNKMIAFDEILRLAYGMHVQIIHDEIIRLIDICKCLLNRIRNK